ncbi:TRAP transporter small permease subunit [Silicimonas algicola]|uniref:TRAP transporter small permease protein n=1 Tax=Silicimonas algicola TaxID=1826607 RepID=A0A316GDI9_9RHOB|nr:TRAP transporter small permease subunit [Silicimonas algicola]AZQ66636.1 TRAP transporter small permease subunit [Silicimonas algicola]PWK58984.1 TRAP-type C4-dicarboxylate transport system permease small subunit [Silicimonas algicola]
MLRKLLEVVCVLLLGALVTVPCVQVIMRDVFNAPIVGAEELTRFLLICTVFAAYPLVVDAGENIVMGEIRESLPDRAGRGILLISSILAVIACAFVAVVVALNISSNLNNATPTLKIPFWIFLGATFLGFAGAAAVHLFHFRKPPQKQTTVSL